MKDLKQVEENFKKAAKGDDKKALDAVLDKLGFAKISEFHERYVDIRKFLTDFYFRFLTAID